jgi:iron complex transport system substrate-binding protein
VPGLEEIASTAVDCGFHIHKELGPGLLESVYETVLAGALRQHGLFVEQQKPVAVTFRDMAFSDAFRADLIVEGSLIIEVKSVERNAPVHAKQLLTYLRLMKQPLGLLMNFGCETFKDGVKRVANGHMPFAP